MRLINVVLVVLLFVAFVQIKAIPRFALRQHDSCMSCHVNPTGGEMRSEDGWYFGKNVVSMISPRDKDIKLSPKIGDNISFGLDYRTQYLYSQAKSRSDFLDMEGSIYTNVDLSNKINVVGRYDFINSIWEGYGILHILPTDGYLKVGSFQSNYGIRIDDHTAYTRGGDFGLLFSTGVRQGLLYDPLYTETGVEAGIHPFDHAMLTASVGKGKYSTTFAQDPTYTARFEVRPSIDKLQLLFGASAASTHLPRSASFYGGFAGFGYENFTLMGEYDASKDFVNPGVKSNFLMVEAAYKILIGLEAVVRYDWMDPNTSIDKDQLAHVVAGFEFYPYSFVEVRPQYRFNIEDANIKNDAFVLQFHFWY